MANSNSELQAVELKAYGTLDASQMINTIDEITKVLKQMSKATSVTKFVDVWGDAETILNRALTSMRSFVKEENNIDAANVVKLTRALSILDENKFKDYFSGYTEAIKKAESMVKDITTDFNIPDMKDAFDAFEKIQMAGGDVREIFDKLGASSGDTEAKIQSLTDKIKDYETTLERANEKIQELESGAKFQSLRDDLEKAQEEAAELTVELDKVRDKLTERFTSFLRANDLMYEEENIFGQMEKGFANSGIEDIFNQVREGLLTDSEAIAKVKAEYGGLIDEISSGSGAASFQLALIETKLNSVANNIEELTTSLKSGDFSSLDHGEESIKEIGTSAERVSGGLRDVTTLLEVFSSSIQESGTNASETAASMTQLVTELSRLDDIDADKLTRIGDVFHNLSKNNGFSISGSGLDRLTDFIEKIGHGDLGDLDKIRKLDNLNLSGLSVNISKSLHNLTDYLVPASQNINVEALERVQKLDFSNLNVNNRSASALAELTKAAATGDRLDALTTEIHDVITAFRDLQTTSKDVETQTKNTFAESFNLKSATKEINKVESEIGGLKVEINDLVSQGATDTATSKLLYLEQQIKKFRNNIDAEGKVVDKDKARSFFEAIRQEAAEAKGEIDKMSQSVQTMAKLDNQLNSLRSKAASKAVVGDKESFNDFLVGIDRVESKIQELRDKKIDLSTKAGQDALKELQDMIAQTSQAYTAGVEKMNAKKLGDSFDVDKATSKVDKINDSLADFRTKVDNIKLSGINTDSLAAKFQELETAVKAFYNAADADKPVQFEAINNALRELKSNLSEVDASKKSLSSLESSLKKLERGLKDVKSSSEFESLSDDVQKVADRIKALRTAFANGSMVPSSDDAKAEIQGIITELVSLDSKLGQVKGTGESAMGGLSEGAKDATSSFAQLTSALSQIWNALGNTSLGKIGKLAFGRAAMYSDDVVREMIRSAVEIESSLAQLQVVTGASGTQLNTFFDAAADSAKRFGVEVKDMLGSIETFSRLGFSLQESLDFSEAATTLSNVAAMSVDEATTGITSIVKGFGMDSSDVGHVADVVTKVGQAYAISGQEIMDAMTRVSAVAGATDTSFEKTTALLAGMNASVQDSAKTGTALRTIMARIRGTKTELEELGEDMELAGVGVSKYRDEIKALTNVDGSGGFDVMADAAGTQFKDVYDILVGIHDVWDQIDDVSRARISEIIAGQRGMASLQSVMQNMDDVVGAYEDALNSAGTAAEANNIVMDTTEKKVEQLKTSFQILSRDIVDSDLTKGIVDFGTQAIDIIDSLINKFGALPVALTAMGGLDIVKNLGKEFALGGREAIAA